MFMSEYTFISDIGSPMTNEHDMCLRKMSLKAGEKLLFKYKAK